MKNLFINKLDQKDVNHFTSNIGLYIRKKINKPFKKACNIFTKANIIEVDNNKELSDDEYFNNINIEQIPLGNYNLKEGKNNIILERYPELEKDESYIFVCNHTCPEDIETVLNVLDRNAYLVLGSVESLKYNPEMYLTWLNGMIPFDIMDSVQRKELSSKMERVLKTNSILIFPEGSHNYHPNKIINNLFDGPVNLSLKTGKKIVVVTLVKDHDNNVSYIDVSNPLDVKKLYETNTINNEKQKIKNVTSIIRDKMATSVYHILLRHIDRVKREDYCDIEGHFRNKFIEEAFKKLKWDKDVFDAEYLVKKTAEEKEYEDTIKSLSNIVLNIEELKKMKEDFREIIQKEIDLKNKDTASCMRDYWLQNEKVKSKKR